MNKAHTERINKELKAAGMSSYGFMKIETKKIPAIIHEDEHIGGVVYGRTTNEKIGSAMLIATDRRIIFLDAKPFYTTMDEVSYDVVSGIKMTVAGPFAGVTLHTRISDYSLRYANKQCSDIFVEYIEAHIEQGETKTAPAPDPQPTPTDLNVEQTYLREHDTAIISTVDREGNARGSIIHYIIGSDDNVYFLTKDSTKKSQDIIFHGQIALTIHDSGSLKMLQMNGICTPEQDMQTKSTVFKQIVKARDYTEGNKLPPVAKIKDGSFTVYRITPIDIRYKDYSQSSW